MQKDVFEWRGINSRLDEIQAAVLRVKLNHLPKWNDERRRLAMYYHQHLRGIGDLQLPVMGDDLVQPVFHLFVVQTQHRTELKEYLKQAGIETAIHYPIPIHRQKAFLDLGYRSELAEKISERVLSLPLWPGLRADEQEQVIQAIKNFFNRHL